MTERRAPPSEWWPAGVEGLTVSALHLATGISLRAIDGGARTDPPVLLIHGWGIHAYLWRRTMPALIAAGYRAIAIDLPGHGLSDRPSDAGSYSLDRMTAHVHAALDALQLQRPHIIAQSMGGRIALELARRHPARVKSLVLFGSVGFGAVPSMVPFARYVPAPSQRLVKRWMIELGEAFTYGRRASVDASFIDEYWAPTQFPDFLSAMRQALIEFDWAPLNPVTLAHIETPTLVIFGTRDRTVKPLNTDALVQALPHGQMHWVRDAGHVANEEAYDEVHPLVLEFLARHT